MQPVHQIICNKPAHTTTRAPTPSVSRKYTQSWRRGTGRYFSPPTMAPAPRESPPQPSGRGFNERRLGRPRDSQKLNALTQILMYVLSNKPFNGQKIRSTLKHNERWSLGPPWGKRRKRERERGSPLTCQSTCLYHRAVMCEPVVTRYTSKYIHKKILSFDVPFPVEIFYFDRIFPSRHSASAL